MSGHPIAPEYFTALRGKAVARLAGAPVPQDSAWNGSAALRALYELACSPATTADALALLHELQVHQVEIDLQSEELRSASALVDAALQAQLQRYDCLPVGLCTIDSATTVMELNATAAEQLGASCEDLLGQPLHAHLGAQGGLELRALITRVGALPAGPASHLTLLTAVGPGRKVYARMSRDATEGRFLLALLDA